MVDAVVINKIQRQVKHREKIPAADLGPERLISLKFKEYLQVAKKKNHFQKKKWLIIPKSFNRNFSKKLYMASVFKKYMKKVFNLTNKKGEYKNKILFFTYKSEGHVQTIPALAVS